MNDQSHLAKIATYGFNYLCYIFGYWLHGTVYELGIWTLLLFFLQFTFLFSLP